MNLGDNHLKKNGKTNCFTYVCMNLKLSFFIKEKLFNIIHTNITFWIQDCKRQCIYVHKPAYKYFCIRVSINLGECWLCPWCLADCKKGADINRPGRSHVSVYTGRPQSSTTRALDSLCKANSHTIHLCRIQKHSHMQHMQILYMWGNVEIRCPLQSFSVSFTHFFLSFFFFGLSSLEAASYLMWSFSHPF